MQATIQTRTTQFSTAGSEQRVVTVRRYAAEQPRQAAGTRTVSLRKFLTALLSAFATPTA